MLNLPVPDICPKPFLAGVDATTFMAQHALQDEVFGPASLVVWTDSVTQTLQDMPTWWVQRQGRPC